MLYAVTGNAFTRPSFLVKEVGPCPDRYCSDVCAVVDSMVAVIKWAGFCGRFKAEWASLGMGSTCLEDFVKSAVLTVLTGREQKVLHAGYIAVEPSSRCALSSFALGHCISHV